MEVVKELTGTHNGVRGEKRRMGERREMKDGVCNFNSTCGLHTHTTLILCRVEEKWCLWATLTEESGALAAFRDAARILDSRFEASSKYIKVR